jgi:hypothetical protein
VGVDIGRRMRSYILKRSAAAHLGPVRAKENVVWNSKEIGAPHIFRIKRSNDR